VCAPGADYFRHADFTLLAWIGCEVGAAILFLTAARCEMATLRFRRGFLWMCFLAVVALPACAGFSRSQASDTAEFTTLVVPAGGAPDALAVADVNQMVHRIFLRPIRKLARLPFCLVIERDISEGSGSPFPGGHLPSDVGVACSVGIASLMAVSAATIHCSLKSPPRRSWLQY
jgi:hypothetical protein